MAVTEDTKRKYERMAEDAIEFGKKMQGAPYPLREDFNPWPRLSPLYSRITRSDPARWYQDRLIICSGLINVLRFEIAGIPSVGWKQDDPWPGGMGAITRQWCDTDVEGVRRYHHVEPTPRGWVCIAPFRGDPLHLQGHIGVALENGARLLEARVPHLSDNRIEEQVSDKMQQAGGAPFTHIAAPWVWLRK
jgi:hypothetical protein